jgi:hypothetical protein
MMLGMHLPTDQLQAGTTLGGVVKGLTGFGSAIIQVLIWVSVATLGSDGGECA